VDRSKENQLPTANGIGYLEAKNHLLLGYCPYIVYYLLRKAKDLSVDGHPVVRSLIEIRLFVEKVRLCLRCCLSCCQQHWYRWLTDDTVSFVWCGRYV
jgi:hypothetical protein